MLGRVVLGWRKTPFIMGGRKEMAAPSRAQWGLEAAAEGEGLTPPTEDRVGLLWGMRSQAPDRLQKLFLGAGINHYQE